MNSIPFSTYRFALAWVPQFMPNELPLSYQIRSFHLSGLKNRAKFINELVGRVSGAQPGLEIGIMFTASI